MKLLRFILSSIATIFLLFFCIVCTPEPENKSNPNEVTVTGETMIVTPIFATFTVYANLPPGLGDADEAGIYYDKEQSFKGAQKVKADDLDNNNEFAVTAFGLESRTTYYFKFYARYGRDVYYSSVKSFTTKEFNGDLGIVMTRGDGSTYSLRWATSNLCESGLCTNPEDYGDYYAWGETEPKSNYYWSTYKWYNGDSGNNLTKYNTVDNKTVLDPEDDVAHVKLGGKWRMPTYDEWAMLFKQCTLTRAPCNGVRGYLVTAANGNSIFLPAAGTRIDTDLCDAGSRSYYWSSSFDAVWGAWCVYLIYDNLGGGYRDRGCSVRPVSE